MLSTKRWDHSTGRIRDNARENLYVNLNCRCRPRFRAVGKTFFLQFGSAHFRQLPVGVMDSRFFSPLVPHLPEQQRPHKLPRARFQTKLSLRDPLLGPKEQGTAVRCYETRPPGPEGGRWAGIYGPSTSRSSLLRHGGERFAHHASNQEQRAWVWVSIRSQILRGAKGKLCAGHQGLPLCAESQAQSRSQRAGKHSEITARTDMGPGSWDFALDVDGRVGEA